MTRLWWDKQTSSIRSSRHCCWKGAPGVMHPDPDSEQRNLKGNFHQPSIWRGQINPHQKPRPGVYLPWSPVSGREVLTRGWWTFLLSRLNPRAWIGFPHGPDKALKWLVICFLDLNIILWGTLLWNLKPWSRPGPPRMAFLSFRWSLGWQHGRHCSLLPWPRSHTSCGTYLEPRHANNFRKQQESSRTVQFKVQHFLTPLFNLMRAKSHEMYT